MQTTYRFRLYPCEEQEDRLSETLDLCRRVYNHFLSQWNRGTRIPCRLELQAQLPLLKKERPELGKVYSKVLQMVLYQLYSNLKALSQLKRNGKRVGRLRFKGRGRFKTLIYNQSGFKIVKTGKRLSLLRLSKIGDIPIRVHREVEGNMKQVVIKRHNSGKWFACISIEKGTHVEKRNVNRPVGIDMGIKHFLTDSEGRQIENPTFYERTLGNIKVEQKRLARKKRESKNRKKQRVKLAKLCERLVNQRNDFLHKLSRFYVDNYDAICVEDLNVSNMVRNHNLAGKILDASWGRFLQMLAYKAEGAGKLVGKVNPRGTSKEYKHGELDRDYNASLNILERGLSGLRWPPVPVEMRPLQAIPANLIVEAGNPLKPCVTHVGQLDLYRYRGEP